MGAIVIDQKLTKHKKRNNQCDRNQQTAQGQGMIKTGQLPQVRLIHGRPGALQRRMMQQPAAQLLEPWVHGPGDAGKKPPGEKKSGQMNSQSEGEK